MISTDISQPLSIVSQCHCHEWDDNPKPISLTIFILLINGRIGREGQQWPHNRVNLNYTVIFLAPLVHTDLLLADIIFTSNNPALNRYLTWLGDFNLIRHTVVSAYIPPGYKSTSAAVPLKGFPDCFWYHLHSKVPLFSPNGCKHKPVSVLRNCPPKHTKKSKLAKPLL